MPSLLKHMEALSHATGWTQLASPDKNSVWSIALEDDLNVVFFPLGDKFVVMRGVVIDLNADANTNEQIIERVAQLQIAVLRNRSSVVAYEGIGESLLPSDVQQAPRIICYRKIDLSVEPDVFVESVQDWLNDLAFWKNNVTIDAVSSAASSKDTFANIFSGIKI